MTWHVTSFRFHFLSSMQTQIITGHFEQSFGHCAFWNWFYADISRDKKLSWSKVWHVTSFQAPFFVIKVGSDYNRTFWTVEGALCLEISFMLTCLGTLNATAKVKSVCFVWLDKELFWYFSKTYWWNIFASCVRRNVYTKLISTHSGGEVLTPTRP